MRRSLLVIAALGALGPAQAALANGRPPATVDVRFKPGNDEFILLAATFGPLFSTDSGATFRWVCEQAVGYGGTYDPDFAVTEGGDIYATTFNGLAVSRDGGCTWSIIEGPFGDKWIGEVEVAPDGRVWAATSDGAQPNDVYRSDDGETFLSAGIERERAWWRTLRVAPPPEPGQPADRIYLTGFQPGTTEEEPEALLFRTDDAGESWIPLPTGDFDFVTQPQLSLLGVSPVDPDVVFLRVLGANPPIGDALYRSSDAGESWSRVLDMEDVISAFTIRSDGQTVIAGTINRCAGEPPESEKGCVRISTDGGLNFEPAPSEPRMACVKERSDGELFACGANWEPDMFALGRSSNADSWDKVFRFVELAGPLECPGDTVQAECAATYWPSLCWRLGICSQADAGVTSPPDAGPGEGGNGGCGCRQGGGAPAGLALALTLALLGARSRNRRDRAKAVEAALAD